jgi:hypothetical protein
MVEITKKTTLVALIAKGMTTPQIVVYRATEQMSRIAQLKKTVGWDLTDYQAEKVLAHYDDMMAKPFRKIPDSEFFYQALRLFGN